MRVRRVLYVRLLWRDLFCIVRNYLKYSVSQRDEIKEISERDAHTQKKDESTHVATRRMDPCLAHRDRARPTHIGVSRSTSLGFGVDCIPRRITIGMKP